MNPYGSFNTEPHFGPVERGAGGRTKEGLWCHPKRETSRGRGRGLSVGPTTSSVVASSKVSTTFLVRGRRTGFLSFSQSPRRDLVVLGIRTLLPGSPPPQPLFLGPGPYFPLFSFSPLLLTLPALFLLVTSLSFPTHSFSFTSPSNSLSPSSLPLSLSLWSAPHLLRPPLPDSRVPEVPSSSPLLLFRVRREEPERREVGSGLVGGTGLSRSGARRYRRRGPTTTTLSETEPASRTSTTHSDPLFRNPRPRGTQAYDGKVGRGSLEGCHGPPASESPNPLVSPNEG